ncbi:unnamed protein product [marine sediment metagenome]|uniref:HTH arsR-type domain-containing protein n=1 Tax=marine sediment metagenome TaxID=412755 RepID=X1NDF6_9ZZZZ
MEKVLARLERKIDRILGSVEDGHRAKGVGEVKGAGSLDIMTLLSLPDHLRKTALTLIKLGSAMADDVAKETGRARAIESAYLNQLVRMEHVWRNRVGKRVYFSVEGKAAGKEPRPLGKEKA